MVEAPGTLTLNPKFQNPKRPNPKNPEKNPKTQKPYLGCGQPEERGGVADGQKLQEAVPVRCDVLRAGAQRSGVCQQRLEHRPLSLVFCGRGQAHPEVVAGATEVQAVEPVACPGWGRKIGFMCRV